MLLQLKSFDWILPLTPPLYRRQHHQASFSNINIIMNKQILTNTNTIENTNKNTKILH